MKLSQRAWLILVIVAVLALGSLTGARASQMLAKPTAVAVVDIQQVLNNLKEREQINADLQVRADKLKLIEQDKQKELEQLQDDLGILAPGADSYKAKQEELEKKAMELQVWRGFEMRKIEMERTIQLEKIYTKMTEACGRAAEQNGYDLVLFKEQPINLRRVKPEEIGTVIASRKVVWHAGALDITDQVVTLMNNDFVNQTR